MSTPAIQVTAFEPGAAVTFDKALEARIEQLLARYPHRRAALLPILWACQDRHGWISPGVMEAVADKVGESSAYVEGVVTFYTMFRTQPPARYVLQVCETLSCAVCGAHDLVHRIGSKLGIKPGEKTADGAFQLVGVQCLGACGSAPVVQINDDYYENLTPERLDEVLDELAGRS